MSEKPRKAGADASPSTRKNQRITVYLYMLVLFGAAFLLLLLAYFVQQRGEKGASGPKGSTGHSQEELSEDPDGQTSVLSRIIYD